MTLTEFLLARIAEDETCAACSHPVVEHLGRWCRVPTGAVNREGRALICCCEATTRNTRVLAECEAKRRIVGEHLAVVDNAWHEEAQYTTRRAVLHLAAVYADHPDYDPAWAPAEEGA